MIDAQARPTKCLYGIHPLEVAVKDIRQTAEQYVR